MCVVFLPQCVFPRHGEGNLNSVGVIRLLQKIGLVVRVGRDATWATTVLLLVTKWRAHFPALTISENAFSSSRCC